MVRWRCNDCGKKYRRNPKKCKKCGHTVLTQYRRTKRRRRKNRSKRGARKQEVTAGQLAGATANAGADIVYPSSTATPSWLNEDTTIDDGESPQENETTLREVALVIGFALAMILIIALGVIY